MSDLVLRDYLDYVNDLVDRSALDYTVGIQEKDDPYGPRKLIVRVKHFRGGEDFGFEQVIYPENVHLDYYYKVWTQAVDDKFIATEKAVLEP